MGDSAARNPDLLRGTVELLILKALTHGRQHGFGIARWLEDVTSDVLHLEEGSLYPALHRMERRGWLEAEWGVSDNNRQVKYLQADASRSRVPAARELRLDRVRERRLQGSPDDVTGPGAGGRK